MIRIPIYTVVVSNQLIFDRCSVDEPAVCCVVQEWCITTPAERIAVLVFFFAVKQSFFRQSFNDIQIAIFHEASSKIRHYIRILTGIINYVHEADAILSASLIVIFTMRWCHVHDPCTTGICNKGSTYDDIAFLCLDVSEWRSVGFADKLGTFMCRKDCVLAFHYFLHQIFGNNVDTVFLLYTYIVHVRVHG
ncbi:hypothetical protein D3C71_1229630 [compost metagenome]